MNLDYFKYSNDLPQLLLALALIFMLQLLITISAGGAATVLSRFGDRIDPRPNRENQIAEEIRGVFGTSVIIAIYFLLSIQFIDHIFPEDTVTALLHILLFLVLYDFYMYVTHRLFHTAALRKYHQLHHTAISATPWSSINLHPIEAIVNYLPFVFFAAVTSVSLSVFLGIHAYLIFGIANSHSNHTFIRPTAPKLMRELALFHQGHHSDGRGNFGYLFTHYDYLFKSKHPDS